ncbi:Gfo/Idh/MocA family oxidoreductase [Candidatus Woesearchaeota archaeon]|nr:Gfo/Idh/MocA family oxidoreductase [Candidatus Woesearchaeota archaeon]
MRGEQLANTYNTNYCNDYHEVLKDTTVKAVIISTPLTTHYEIAKASLTAGKHVLLEKAMVQTVEHAEELVKLASQKNRILMVGHIFRYSPVIDALKKMIHKNQIGRVRFMYSSRMGLMTPRPDCGVIMDFATHDFDTMNYLLQANPTEVSATGMSYTKRKFEDVAFINLKYGLKSKYPRVIVNIQVSWLTPLKIRELWVIGEKKSVKADLNTNQLYVFNKTIIPTADSFGSYTLLTKQGDTYMPYIDNKEPLKNEIDHFVKCIRKKKSPLSEGKISIEPVRIANAALDSIKLGKTIVL